MNRLDRLVGWFAPERGLARARARIQAEALARFYDAARPGRATHGWPAPQTSAASETYAALPWLRARSRDLERNNPHIAKMNASLVDNLVGDGIMPKANTGDEQRDAYIDREIAAPFFEALDADGMHDLVGLQRLGARIMISGGEAVLRRRRRFSSDALPLPLQLQLLEGDFIDNRKNAGTQAGGRVVQGVEFDTRGRRRGYWMFRDHPSDAFLAAAPGSVETGFLPAGDVALCFEAQRAGQVRGVPWSTPAMVRARLLDDYEDAERQRKRMESSTPIIVHSNQSGGEASEGRDPSLYPTLVDADGRLAEEVMPGLIAYLRGDTTVEVIKPADAMGYAPYKRSELQSIAAGGRVPYEFVAGDLTGTNYSSIQAGRLDYKAMIFGVRRGTFIPQFCQPIWRWMIDGAIVAGRLPEGTPYGVTWHPPEWQEVDAEKAENAWLQAIRSGRKTLFQAIASTGRDPVEHLGEIAKAMRLLDAAGIILDSDARRVDRRGVFQNPDRDEQAGA